MAPQPVAAKKLEQLLINDPDHLEEEFYQAYDPDFWLYKITLLRNCHEHFTAIKETLLSGVSGVSDDDFRRVLRTEMHFLYFQMVETLFELIFAVVRHRDRDLWLALSFSNDRKTHFYSDTYTQISQLSSTSELFTKTIAVKDAEGVEHTIPLLRWVLYFVYSPELTVEQWAVNIDNITRALVRFAEDFSDRAEYNAYKHSLRCYNAKFAISINDSKSNEPRLLGASEDAITYLGRESEKSVGSSTFSVRRMTKAFDFERDHNCCLVIHSMINNVIATRKRHFCKDTDPKQCRMHWFVDTDMKSILTPKAKVTKFGFEV